MVGWPRAALDRLLAGSPGTQLRRPGVARDLIKDAELLALRYENAVLLRRSSGHRTSRPTGCGPRRWRSWPGSFRAFEADLDGLFFAFTMANLAGRILAYACGSEAQAVALMDNLINGLVRERARTAA